MDPHLHDHHFGALFATIVLSAAKDLARQGHPPGRMNAEFPVIFGLAAITAAITRREWYQHGAGIRELVAERFGQCHRQGKDY
jgi:hypothetical protein